MPIDTPTAEVKPISPGGALTTIGTVVAVLFAVPASFIGIYGVINIVSGDAIAGGLVSVTWALATVLGAYELNRSKFGWERGQRRQHINLGLGIFAVSTAMVASAALENLLFVFAIFPALAGIIHARARYEKMHLVGLYGVIVVVSLISALWLYSNEYHARQLVAWVETLP